jgi:hypothetical protein
MQNQKGFWATAWNNPQGEVLSQDTQASCLQCAGFAQVRQRIRVAPMAANEKYGQHRTEQNRKTSAHGNSRNYFRALQGELPTSLLTTSLERTMPI